MGFRPNGLLTCGQPLLPAPSSVKKGSWTRAGVGSSSPVPPGASAPPDCSQSWGRLQPAGSGPALQAWKGWETVRMVLGAPVCWPRVSLAFPGRVSSSVAGLEGASPFISRTQKRAFLPRTAMSPHRTGRPRATWRKQHSLRSHRGCSRTLQPPLSISSDSSTAGSVGTALLTPGAEPGQSRTPGGTH